MSKNSGLKNYETVKSRKKRIRDKYEDCRIISEAIHVDDKYAFFKATIYLTKQDQIDNTPFSTGFAREIAGSPGANKTSWCENCEESAIGRALDNAGYAGNDKCSREEMVKVLRNKILERIMIHTRGYSEEDRGVWVRDKLKGFDINKDITDEVYGEAMRLIDEAAKERTTLSPADLEKLQGQVVGKVNAMTKGMPMPEKTKWCRQYLNLDIRDNTIWKRLAEGQCKEFLVTMEQLEES